VVQKAIRLGSTVAFLWAVGSTLAAAQYEGRSQDGFYSGQSNGQYSGRVDGRGGGHSQGLPPSAADRSNRTFDNPVTESDCAEVKSIAPDIRPGWQARVSSACDSRR
jgi:hypothetical protein